MKQISKKTAEFNDFRFEGLNWRVQTNKYYTMDRVSADESKIVVKVGDSHIISMRFGYALILDVNHVVFLKDWQVSQNYYGSEVLLQKSFFNVKEWGDFEDFDEEPQNLSFERWLGIAKLQENYVDEDGWKLNPVKWEI